MAIEEVGGEEERGVDANRHTWEEEVVIRFRYSFYQVSLYILYN